jgi:hypothetical protein
MGDEMSLLDRLRADPTSSAAPPRRTSAGASRVQATGPSSLSVATRAAARAAEATGLVMAALSGVWTAALSWLCVALPVLLVWAASGQTTAPWGQAVRVATDGWLLLHRIGVDVPGGRLQLLPLALAGVPVGLAWAAGRRIGAGLADSTSDPGDAPHDRGEVPHDRGRGGARGPAPQSGGTRSPVRALALPLGGFALGYGAVVVVAAALARGDGVAPVLWQAVLLGPLVPLLGAVPAALRAVGAPVARTLADLARLPDRVRRTWRAAGVAGGLLVAAGALLVAVSLVVHHDRVATLHAALAPGAVGGAVLVLVEAALVPNFALWGVSFVAGPGFLVGAGSLVTPGASQLGLLPLVPVLGAVPPPGPMPALLGGVLLLPVLAGAVAGWVLARRADGRSVLDVVCDALTAAALAAVGLAVLVGLAGGSAGPGALATVGASPWRAGLALAGELAAGAAAAAWITHRRRPS